MSKPVVYKTQREDVMLSTETLGNMAEKLAAADARPIHVVSEALTRSVVNKAGLQRVHLYLKHFPAAGVPLRVGTNKAVHGLASGLVTAGAAVEVWCEGERDSQTMAPEGYLIRCFATRAGYRTLRLAPALRAHLQTLQAEHDLVVLNGMFHPSVYALSRRLGALDIPYVVAPHGPYHPWLFRKNPHLKWPYWYLVERNALKGALALQQLDRRHEIWARRLGITVPIVATENGFLNNDLVPAQELRWRTRAGEPIRVLYWGRMDMHTKGLDVLLRGFAQVPNEHSMQLTMQGPDWAGEVSAVHSLIESLNLGSRVTVLPPNFDTIAGRVMNAYDIVCMSSRFEGFGLAALEAMLAARVLLVSRTAGIAPHVEKCDCGVVVEPNETDIQHGLVRLLSLRSRWREMGLRGRDYAMANLHWNRIAERTLLQYRELLDQTHAGRDIERQLVG